jgi:hypothetical protein
MQSKPLHGGTSARLGGFPRCRGPGKIEGMMTQVLIGFGAGILLGLRWKFMVLYPATLLVAAFMIVAEGLSWQNASLIVLVIIALQAGYICGAATWELVRWVPSPGHWRPILHRH